MNKPSIAICVCSSGTRASLHDCIMSLQAQKNGPFNLIVVLIDNSPFANVGGLFQNIGSHPFYYVHAPEPGIPFARNQALNFSLSHNVEWIAFIDDDEVAPPLWISRLFDAAVKNDADVIEGGVMRVKSLQKAIELSQMYESKTSLKHLSKVKTAVTSNVLFKSRLIMAPYDLSFDEKMVFGGSDREFFMRAVLAGAKIVNAPNELVFEVWPEERISLKYALLRWFRYGVSFNYRYSKNYSFFKSFIFIMLMFLFKLAGVPFKFLLSPLRIFGLKQAIHWRPAIILADIAFALGCIGPYFGVSLNRYY